MMLYAPETCFRKLADYYAQHGMVEVILYVQSFENYALYIKEID